MTRIARSSAGRPGTLLLALAILLLPVVTPTRIAAGECGARFQQYTKKIAEGGKRLVTRTATYFGGDAIEEFTAAASLPDGRILVFGNTWGKELPGLKPVILGKGAWYDVPLRVELPPDGFQAQQPRDTLFCGSLVAIPGKPKEIVPVTYTWPNISGFILVYGQDCKRIEAAAKFDSGVGTIVAGELLADGDILIAGNCTERLAQSIGSGTSVITIEAPKPQGATAQAKADSNRDILDWYGAIYHGNLKRSGDTYVARLSPDFKTWRWVCFLKNHRWIHKKLWVIDSPTEKAVVVVGNGVNKISLDGKTVVPRCVGDNAKQFIGIDPLTGDYIYGGERKVHTGHEWWLQPVLKCYHADGALAWSGYEWHPTVVGHESVRLVGNASVKAAAFDGKGGLFLAMWAEGENTVCSTSPFDLRKRLPNTLAMSTYGAAAANQVFLQFVHLDLKTATADASSLWAAYAPDSGAANPSSANHMIGLEDGSLAWIGMSGPTLIQTMHNYRGMPQEAYDQLTAKAFAQKEKLLVSGPYVAVFDRKLGTIAFSSYIPNCEPLNLGRTADGGLIIVGRSIGPDKAKPENSPPVLNALQPQFGGGDYDAHLIVLGKEQ